MAVLALNTNVSSLQTQRRLAVSTSALSKSYERLSSGLRVSRASDDAAGLAISSGLNVDSRVLGQGLRNLSDGVSVTNIAEGALNELTNIVTRLQELAQQSINGTLGAKQRAALDAEAQALSKEYFRISKTTEFNGQKLFDGTLQGLSFQAGYGAAGALQSSLGGNMGTGSFSTAVSFGTGGTPLFAALGDLNADGNLDIVSANVLGASSSVLLGNGDGSFRAKADYTTVAGPYTVALGDLNGDGILDIVSASFGGMASALIGNGDGTFKAKADFVTGSQPYSVSLGDLDGDGALDIVTANHGTNSVSALLGNGDGTFKTKADFTTASASYSVALGDLNDDGVLDIVTANDSTNNVSALLGNGDGSFKAKVDFATGTQPYSVALGDVNGDNRLDIVAAAFGASNASVLIGNGDGSFRAKSDYATDFSPRDISLGDLNGDGALDIVSANSNGNDASVLLGNGDGTFKAKLDFGPASSPYKVALGDLNGNGVLDIVCVNAGNSSVSVLLATTREGISPLLDFSLKTKAAARQALPVFKQVLNNLSQQRGIVGANQSRLSTAIANIQVGTENYQAAASQITDVDVATESSTLLKLQILQQSASAVLAQANQTPALALTLLRR